MGTRALVKLYSRQEEIVVIYRQFDGYEEGLGLELAEYLRGFQKPTNGMIGGEKLNKQCNGMNCLAAQLVGHLKTNVGNAYLYPAGTNGIGEEYIYQIRFVGNDFEITGEKINWDDNSMIKFYKGTVQGYIEQYGEAYEPDYGTYSNADLKVESPG